MTGAASCLGPSDQRLEFPLSEWRSAAPPIAGQIVDFVEEGGQARAVFAVPGASGGVLRNQRSLVLGWIGVGCLVLGFIIPLIPTIAAFVLGVVGASQAQADGDDTALLLTRIAWIGALVLLVIGFLAILAVVAFVGTLGLTSIWLGADGLLNAPGRMTPVFAGVIDADPLPAGSRSHASCHSQSDPPARARWRRRRCFKRATSKSTSSTSK